MLHGRLEFLLVSCLILLPAASLGQELRGAKIEVRDKQPYGQYLTGGDGRALYMFTADRTGESRCYDRCAEAWPPMITSEAPRKGEKVNQRMVDTIRRKDNRQQVSYDSMPLYYYARDQGSGSTLGQDVKGGGGEWYLVSPEGRSIKEPVKS